MFPFTPTSFRYPFGHFKWYRNIFLRSCRAPRFFCLDKFLPEQAMESSLTREKVLNL